MAVLTCRLGNEAVTITFTEHLNCSLHNISDDDNRVVLHNSDEQDSSDYINASYVTVTYPYN